MTAKKKWAELSQSTRDKRFVVMANNHLPRTDRPLGTFADLHAKCANGAGCAGPGCRRTR